MSAPLSGLLLADGADEAGGVVGLAQGGDHLPLHKVPAAIAAGAVHALVVQRAQILSILHEEAPLGQVTAAHWKTHTHRHSESQVIQRQAGATHKASNHQPSRRAPPRIAGFVRTRSVWVMLRGSLAA